MYFDKIYNTVEINDLKLASMVWMKLCCQGVIPFIIVE